MISRVKLPSLILAAILACTGAGNALTQQQPAETLRYAIWSNPNGTFHPTLYFSNYDRDVLFNVYSRLFTLDEKQNPAPDLATGYRYENDGRSLVVSLRDGVKWHDGTTFSAEDVAYTFASSAEPGFPRDYSPFVQNLEGFADYSTGVSKELPGIEVLDPLTVRFTFRAPYAAAFSAFADRPILAKHIWSKIPVSQWAEATETLQNPVGTGPFRFVRFVPDQFVELERNADYYSAPAKIEHLIYVVSNAQTAQTALINGELDIVPLSSWNPRDIQTFTDAGIKIDEQTGTSAQYLALDSTDPRLSDVRVRQAILHAIDRDAIVQRLLFGHGVVFNSNAHPDSPYYPSDLNPYPYDIEKAKALLRDAGWSDTNGDGIIEKDGQPFTFTLNFPTGNRTRELSAPIIQQYLRTIGIDAQLISADFNSTLAILQDPSVQYDGVLMGGTFRPGLYDNNHWWERFQNDRLVALSEQFDSTVEPDELKVHVSDWLREVNDQAIRAWLYIPNIGFAVNPRVQGFHPYPYEPFAGVTKWSVDN